MQIFKLVLLVWFGIATLGMQAQIPNTDIYLLEISVKKNKVKVLNHKKVTENPGYDNQPYFTDDGKYLYYTSIVNSEQADIYRLDLLTLKAKQVTRTSESEYSPTPISGSTAITTVRVDRDSSQRLYELYPFSRKPPKMLFNEVDDIGYHCWLNENYVAMFRLEETFNLYIAHLNTNRVAKADEQIGRCLQRIPGSDNLSYVSKKDTNNWVIKKYNLRNQSSTIITPVYNQNEDFVWVNETTLLMADKGVLFCMNTNNNKWLKLKDLSKELGNFYRLHINKDKTIMAVVTYTGNKP